MLITILMFIFQKVLPLIFFGRIWSHDLAFLKLTEIYLYRGKDDQIFKNQYVLERMIVLLINPL